MSKKFIKCLFFLSFIFAAWGADFVIDKVTTPDAPTETNQPYLYSNQCGDDLRGLYIECIQNAKESIDLVIYTLTDRAVIRALRKKAESGVKVTIICDPSTPLRIQDELGPKVSFFVDQKKGLMHQKILVIDEKLVLLGSANLSRDSLKLSDNIVVGLEHPALAKALLKERNAIFFRSELPYKTPQTYLVGGQRLELWMLPQMKGGDDKIISMLKTAKKTVQIAMYTWTHEGLAQAVVDAHLRGVNVQVYIDETSYDSTSQKVAKLLEQNGVPTYPGKSKGNFHYKLACIDSTTLICGSTNWTKAAFRDNRDVFLIFYDLNIEQQATFKKLWKEISKAEDYPEIIGQAAGF